MLLWDGGSDDYQGNSNPQLCRLGGDVGEDGVGSGNQRALGKVVHRMIGRVMTSLRPAVHLSLGTSGSVQRIMVPLSLSLSRRFCSQTTPYLQFRQWLEDKDIYKAVYDHSMWKGGGEQ